MSYRFLTALASLSSNSKWELGSAKQFNFILSAGTSAANSDREKPFGVSSQLLRSPGTPHTFPSLVWWPFHQPVSLFLSLSPCLRQFVLLPIPNEESKKSGIRWERCSLPRIHPPPQLCPYSALPGDFWWAIQWSLLWWKSCHCTHTDCLS
jgi:hypothetical protein